MKALFLTPQLPFPPRQGTAIRNWGLLSFMASRHQLSLVSFAPGGAEGNSVVAPELAAVCQTIDVVGAPMRPRLARIAALYSAQPDLARRMYSLAFEQALSRRLLAEPFDIVQIEGLEMAAYLPLIKRLAPANKLIYDAHNAEYVLQASAAATDRLKPSRWPWAAYSYLQSRRLRAYEADVCAQADAVTCVSREDAEAIERVARGIQPVVVPNGLHMQEYAAWAGHRSSHNRLVFTGKMDYRPNLDAALWFATRVLPLIRVSRPDTEFLIVGQRPPPALLALDGIDGVRVTGAVKDTRPFIAAAAVYVAPLRMGGGTRLKLLEAMALNRPVVATTIGAEGFEFQSGRELLMADGEKPFASAVLQLLQDEALAARLAQAGHNAARAAYDWSVIGPRMEAVYARLFEISGQSP